MSPILSRRVLLRAALSSLGTLLVAACEPQIVEVEKIVEAKPAPVEPITIRYAHSWTEETWMGQVQKAMLERYDNMVPGTNIKVELMLGVDFDALDRMLAAGDPPEVFWHMFRKSTFDAIDEGLFVCVQDVMEADGISLDIFTDACRKQYSSGYIDGKMWAFPYEVVVHLWTYDARMFREAGVEPPKKDWTWLDLIDLGTKMTRDKSGKHPNEEGFDVNDVDCWGIGPWYYFLGNEHYYRIAGGEYLSPDMKRITINTEPFYEVFAFFREIFRERQIGVKTRPEKGLQTGKIALYETGNWALIGLERDVPELMAVYPPTHPETNILSTPLPQKELWIPKQKDPEIADAAYRFGKWWSLEMYVDFAVLTGYIPYLKRDLEDIRWKNLIADKPFMQVAQELVPHGRARFYTLFPLAAEAVPIMTELWDAIEATDTPPEQLLSKAEAECQRILEKGLQKYPNWISPYF